MKKNGLGPMIKNVEKSIAEIINNPKFLNLNDWEMTLEGEIIGIKEVSSRDGRYIYYSIKSSLFEKFRKKISNISSNGYFRDYLYDYDHCYSGPYHYFIYENEILVKAFYGNEEQRKFIDNSNYWIGKKIKIYITSPPVSLFAEKSNVTKPDKKAIEDGRIHILGVEIDGELIFYKNEYSPKLFQKKWR